MNPHEEDAQVHCVQIIHAFIIALRLSDRVGASAAIQSQRSIR
jgi:hypothetical protein